MSERTIVVLNDAAAPHLQRLRGLPAKVVIGASVAEVAAAAPEAEVLLVGAVGRRLVEEVWAQAPNVRWVHSMWAGLETLLFEELVKSDVVLTNGRGVFARSLAEFAMLGMLWFAKDVRRLRRQQRGAQWEKFMVTELHGATLGIIGHGSIGRATSALAAAFGMNVHGIGRYHTREEFERILETSDYLLIAAPLTGETRGMIGAEEFRRMKRTAVILNLGRGPVVDEGALIDALASSTITGAVLDVYNQEPLPADHPFWKMDNVLLSPHCADNTATWLDEAVDLFLDNYQRYVNEEPLRNVTDKEAGY